MLRCMYSSRVELVGRSIRSPAQSVSVPQDHFLPGWKIRGYWKRERTSGPVLGVRRHWDWYLIRLGSPASKAVPAVVHLDQALFDELQCCSGYQELGL